MTITTIQYSGIRAQSGTHSLSPLTVVAGPNGSGKTSMLEAVRFAISGRCSLRGTDSSIYAGKGDAQSVAATATFSNGEQVGHRLSKAGRSVSKTVHGNESMVCDSATLNCAEFLGLNAKEMTDYLCRRFGLATIDSKEVNALVAAVDLDAPPSLRNHAYSEASKALQALPQQQEPAVAAIACLEEQARLTAAAAKRLAASIEGHVTGAGTAVNIPADIDGQIVTARAALESALTTSNAADVRLKEARRDLEKRQRLSLALSAPKEDKDGQVREINEAIEAAETELKALGPLRSELRDKYARQTADLRSLEAACDLARRDATTAENEVAACLEDLRKLQSALDNLDAATCCPHCGADGPEWRAKSRTSLAEQMAFSGKNLSFRRDRLEQLRKECEQAQAQGATARKVVEQTMHDGIDASHRITQLEQIVLYRRQQLRLLAEAAAQRQEMENAFADLAPPPDVSLLEASCTATAAAVDEARKQVAALESLQRQAVASRAAAAQLEKLEQLKDQTEATSRFFKLAAKAVQDARQAAVDSATRRLVERANSFSAIVLRDPLQWRAGEIGRSVGGLWVPIADFSDGEKLLCFAGITLALSEGNAFRLLLVDELGALSRAAANDFLRSIVAMLDSGQLHQAIVATSFPPFALERVGAAGLVLLGDC